MSSLILIDATGAGVWVLSWLENGLVRRRQKTTGKHPDLLLALDKFVKSIKLPWGKITALVLLEGQGSFSGVRQAAAVLNVIHLVKKIDVWGMDVRRFSSQKSLLEAIAAEARKKHGSLRPIYSGEPNITSTKKNSLCLII